MRKLKIGIDIDNVISDSYSGYIARFNEAFKTSILYEEVIDFYYLDRYRDKEGRQGDVFVEALLRDEKFQLTLPPFYEAIGIIKNWHRKGCSIHYITARPSYTKEVTVKWLQKHGFLLSEATLDLCDYERNRTDTEFKKEVVERLGIDIIIEDSVQIASVMEIPVLLLDRPWNQGKLPKNFFRVKEWQEIDQFVSLFKSSQ